MGERAPMPIALPQSQKWLKNDPKRGRDATWALGPTNFDSAHHFTPTLGGPDTLGAFGLHPNDQKGLKKAQKGPKWLKMTKNGPKRGLDATWALETHLF